MSVLLLTQYLDTLSSVGANSIFLEHDPATVANLQATIGSHFLKDAPKKKEESSKK